MKAGERGWTRESSRDDPNAEVKVGSEDALEAVKANDPAALRKAMARIGNGCNDCHKQFRGGLVVQKDLDDLVQVLRAEKVDRAKVKKMAENLKQTYALEDLMAKVYKSTNGDGIGYDPAKKGPGDGIEKRIIDLGTKKELTKVQIQLEKDLLLRAAYYNLAMVEIAKAFAPTKVRGGMGPKQWHQHNDEFGAGTKDAIEAVKANDPKALKKAMGRVGASCNGCHTDFRK